MKIPFARYGIRELLLFTGLLAVLSVVCFFFGYVAAGLICLVAAGFVLFFFRDPARHNEVRKEDVLAPADGRIVEIEKVFDKTFLNGEVWKIGIFLSLLDVHLNRAPCGGVVEHLSYRKGTFYNASRAAASERNERTVIGILNSDFNTKLVVKQIAGVIARRIVCELQEGQAVLPGQKFGMIKFGSRTELYVPIEHFRLKARLGQHVKAGISVLGELK
jgi:phosphatidylserine decarboxylase